MSSPVLFAGEDKVPPGAAEELLKYPEARQALRTVQQWSDGRVRRPAGGGSDGLAHRARLGCCTERLQGVVKGVVTTKVVVTTQGGVVTTPPF